MKSSKKTMPLNKTDLRNQKFLNTFNKTKITFALNLSKIIVLILLFAACKKTAVNPIETGNSSNLVGKIIDNKALISDCNFDNTIMQDANILTNVQQTQYLATWKKMFLLKNKMNDTYFNNHLINATVSSNLYDAGVAFRVDYLWNYGWIQVHGFDSYLVKLNSNYGNDRNINVSRNKLLTEAEILNVIYYLPETQLTNINEFTTLKFSSCSEVKNYIKQQTGYPDIQLLEPSFYVHHKDTSKNGDPYLKIGGTINKTNNTCISGGINIRSGDMEIFENACIVTNK